MSDLDGEVSEPGERRRSITGTSDSSKRARSRVWEHFELLEEVNGKKRGKCIYCRRVSS